MGMAGNRLVFNRKKKIYIYIDGMVAFSIPIDKYTVHGSDGRCISYCKLLDWSINIFQYVRVLECKCWFLGGFHDWRKLPPHTPWKMVKQPMEKKINSNIIGGNGINTIVCHLFMVSNCLGNWFCIKPKSGAQVAISNVPFSSPVMQPTNIQWGLQSCYHGW